MNGSLIAIIVILVLCLVLAGIIYYTYCRIREKLRDTSRMLFGTDSMIEGMKQTFDYVIIDTPPLGSVVDAALIAKTADASVLVISANAVSRRMANSVKEQLINANPNFLGVILNKADEGTKHYGYGKRYGSKYGYGYGYGRYGQNPKE